MNNMENGKSEKTEKKKRKRNTLKNNVALREKLLANGNTSLYLDIYHNGIRSYKFLRLYINNGVKTPLERKQNKITWDLANATRTQYENELNHGIYGFVAPGKEKMNFFSFAESVLNTYMKKDIRMLKGAINRFRKFIETSSHLKPATLRIIDIDKRLVQSFVDYLIENSQGEGAHSCFQRFKKILTFAVESKFISSNPALGINCQVDTESVKKDILTNEEISILGKTQCSNSEVKRAFIFCCCTGLRFCDVKELKYSDVDFSSWKLSFNQLKTSHWVILDLNNTSQRLIGEPKNTNDFIFNLPSYNGCSKTLKNWVKKATINKVITWHCARHSYAVNLLTSSQHPDIKTVSNLLGHASLKHTEKYTRIVDDLKKKAINALPDYEF